METPIAVANYFLKQAFKEGLEISPMKLVKLVYIAHGWNLGLSGEPLLSEQVEAWKYGPVTPSVYHKFKEYGNSPITSLGISMTFPKGAVIPQISNEETKPLLDKVWEVYKEYNGLQLSTLTHQAGTPWYKTWHDKGGKSSNGIPIPNKLILEYYQEKAKPTSNAVAL